MGKKKDLANKHIEILIDELVDTRETLNRYNCCYYYNSAKKKSSCIHDCGTCKENFYMQMKNDLRKIYLVN